MASPEFAARRMQAIGLFETVLPRAMAIELESVIRWQVASNEDPRFLPHYSQKVRGLLFNLRNPNNTRLLTDVLEGRIAMQRLVQMDAIELFPEGYWINEKGEVKPCLTYKVLTS